jgi:signal peptidase II
MLEVGNPVQRLRSLLLFAFSVGLLGCDHATKLVAQRELGAGRVVSVVPKVLELRYARNDDVAFSALAHWEIPHKASLLLGVSFLVLAVTLFIWVRHRLNARGTGFSLADFGFAFVLAGAFGNVLDRLARGYVIDFIHLSHWPIFNVADACIVVGLIALGLSRSKIRASPATLA